MWEILKLVLATESSFTFDRNVLGAEVVSFIGLRSKMESLQNTRLTLNLEMILIDWIANQIKEW